ncbi:uncharacterized protein B0H18DRAFT_546314 [Fomitopsis serialis]|uniref:uncharacterized protein n=1 Tax=Fomitopsis serialis TaxID=139415 RepID=UPI0020073F14|nr:uncharacterized protein B0H18DRAFT_546314 [Neoantrodia serialis]KAH9934170.1 hypothetical protein B0H18DRAFT_546314 [Neoantrodia serialis]
MRDVTRGLRLARPCGLANNCRLSGTGCSRAESVDVTIARQKARGLPPASDRHVGAQCTGTYFAVAAISRVVHLMLSAVATHSAKLGRRVVGHWHPTIVRQIRYVDHLGSRFASHCSARMVEPDADEPFVSPLATACGPRLGSCSLVIFDTMAYDCGAQKYIVVWEGTNSKCETTIVSRPCALTCWPPRPVYRSGRARQDRSSASLSNTYLQARASAGARWIPRSSSRGFYPRLPHILGPGPWMPFLLG